MKLMTAVLKPLPCTVIPIWLGTVANLEVEDRCSQSTTMEFNPANPCCQADIAAKRGQPEPLFLLAICYARGPGVLEFTLLAIEYLSSSLMFTLAIW